MKKRTKYILITLVLVAIVVVVALYKTNVLGDNNQIKKVETLQLKKSAITQTVSATGKIQPEIEVKISSEVSGEIIDLPVKEGQVVKKGELLVRINPDLYESGVDRMVASLSNSKAGLNQAEAQLKEAKLNYDRNKILFEKGVISKAEWDKVVSAYEVATAVKNAAFFTVQSTQASLTESKDNLNRTTIYAPVDGTISRLDVELGERVLGTQQMAGTELLRVANLNNMEVEVDVNENDIVKIKVGNEAKIEVDAYLKKEFRGVVTSISNSASVTLTADQVTNFKVKVRISKESYEDLLDGKPSNYSPFRPGMTATVDIVTNKREGIFTVPISAIVMKAVQDSLGTTISENMQGTDATKPQEAVFVLTNGVAKLKWIKTGIQDDRNIEIIEGLQAEDVIIVGPYAVVNRELEEGQQVQREINIKVKK
ncbi:efflux RND transporter periplasmic adaptor subunit [Flavobacterium sp. HSC-61S13]|uniref:efflux RND transporter periplasmic adaptor subunit n=1 Tax=Flavobacterium sp. HSC-61S13 TaxID=2910963 RepID=UPI0020A17192|nr:efflux RND transporter periplasmic adaptor subunit [Flavobacterium sp. HSC-61S13]MCP1996963.1 HlyD family secretion protein [Flavobacterium sp. HSC-61S13]